MQLVKSLVVIVVPLLAFAPAWAQSAREDASLQRGDRLRVVSSDLGAGRFEATYLGLRDGDILLHVPHLGREVTVPTESILELQVSEGPKTRIAQNMGLGLLIGASLGAGLGFATPQDRDSWVIYTTEDKAVAGAIVGGALGLLIGYFKGADTKVETWRAVHVENLRFGVLPGRAPGAVLVLDF